MYGFSCCCSELSGGGQPLDVADEHGTDTELGAFEVRNREIVAQQPSFGRRLIPLGLLRGLFLDGDKYLVFARLDRKRSRNPAIGRHIEEVDVIPRIHHTPLFRLAFVLFSSGGRGPFYDAHVERGAWRGEFRSINHNGERDVRRLVRAPEEVIAFPLKADVGGRRLFPGGHGVDHLDECLQVLLLLLTPALLLPASLLINLLRNDYRRRAGERGHRDGQCENPTNFHHLSPELVAWLFESITGPLRCRGPQIPLGGLPCVVLNQSGRSTRSHGWEPSNTLKTTDHRHEAPSSQTIRIAGVSQECRASVGVAAGRARAIIAPPRHCRTGTGI